MSLLEQEFWNVNGFWALLEQEIDTVKRSIGKN